MRGLRGGRLERGDEPVDGRGHGFRQIDELDAWERDVLFPLATQKIEIDLDDGVKTNYPKFGAALKPIKGLNDSDD